MSAPRNKKPAPVNLDALTGNLATLRAIAGDEMTQEAILLLRENLELTPHKLMLMIKRVVAPEAHIGQGDEQTIRGIGKDTTLKGYKDQGYYPYFINGTGSLNPEGGQRG